MARFRSKYLKIFVIFSMCAVFYIRYLAPVKPQPQQNESTFPLSTSQRLNRSFDGTPKPFDKNTSSFYETVGDRYAWIGYFDVKENDLACDKDGSCHEFRVRNPRHAMMLCEAHGKECQGFVFAPKTGRLFLKASVSGETEHEGHLQFYVKKIFRNNVKILEERQCAVPIGSYLDSSNKKCVLPVLDPFNKHIMRYFATNKQEILCPGKTYTKYKNGVLSLVDSENSSFKNIQVQSITRKQHSDWDFTLTDKYLKFPLVNSSKIDEEFLQINIETSTGEKVVEFHAEVVPKPEVFQRKRSVTGLKTNVLMVGFDSTSSAQMQRALPEVYKFLKDDLDSYIFQGYSVVGDGTTPQLTAILTGSTETELPEARRGYPNSSTIDAWPWIFKDYRNHGYATMYSEDDSYFNSFNYRLHGFQAPPTDHYSRPFWQAAPTDDYCVKRVPQVQQHLSYVESFMEAYRDVPKFGMAFLASISHNNINSLRPAQDYVLKFLKSVKEKGFLDDTVFIMFSDHGMRYGDARVMMQGKLEERLPFLSVTLPKSTRHKFRQLGVTLKENTQILTSPFDMHATLRHILSFSSGEAARTKIGTSLFRKIPENRGCSDCGIPEHYCPCVQLKEVSTAHVHIVKAAERLVDYINEILTRDSLSAKNCARLKLGEIRSAYQNLNHPKLVSFRGSKDVDGRIPEFDNDGEDYECIYHVLVETVPGHALFEATVQLFDGKIHFEKEISRINEYGDQPKCIAEERPYLRKFCFCKSRR